MEKETQDEQPYFVRSMMFKGADECGYTYELCLNKSLVHTGKLKGIEDGLNRYENTEVHADKIIGPLKEIIKKYEEKADKMDSLFSFLNEHKFKIEAWAVNEQCGLLSEFNLNLRELLREVEE